MRNYADIIAAIERSKNTPMLDLFNRMCASFKSPTKAVDAIAREEMSPFFPADTTHDETKAHQDLAALVHDFPTIH